MRVLAQEIGGELPDPSLTDNLVLDHFEIPFGPWMEQMANWITLNLKWVLSIVEWPFKTLLGFIVGDILEPISWVWVVLAFFVIGSLVRNLKVGAFAALGLGVCGILGNAYWLETSRTIGYIGVAVLLCVIIGVPLGIACGRVDSVWQVTRPVLDAMQVVHSFVYMLPFIWWFGVGEVSATMVTMVFALPPLVRLTNLGIRQVPADVVEASRAYGAPEWRVLTDVQIPLARPAIMTGINQTLLLAISMLGIAAIMGAGGLGRLLFNAINNQDVAKGAASGLAFFLVAVVLDRISQREGEVRVGLLRRIRLAWAHRRDPETLLTAETQPAGGAPATEATEGSFAAVASAERTPVMVAAAGGLLTALSVFLTWSSGAGFISAYGRRGDEELAGQSFNGLSASGGSWFGYLAFALGLFVVAAAVTTLVAPGRGPRWWTTDGSVIASLALLVMMVCYVLTPSSDLTVGQADGVGVYAALIGGLVAAVGSLRWIRLAPHSPIHPLSARIGWGRVTGSIVAVLLLGVGAISAWSFDERVDDRANVELQAQIAALEAEAEANPQNAGFIAVQISTLEQQFTREEVLIITDGVSDRGTRLGIWTFLVGLAGLVATLPAAGIFGRHEHRQWEWSAITAGVGAGIISVAFGWVFTHVRSADDGYLTGAGSFLVMVGGCVLLAAAAGVLKEFRRSKVYSDGDARSGEVSASAADSAG